MAHQIGFQEANDILLAPKGMSPEECKSLEVYRDGKYCISRWQLTDEDLEELKKNGGKIYLMVLANCQPPVRIDLKSPFKKEVKKKRAKRKTD